jgi:hypothetical protein
MLHESFSKSRHIIFAVKVINVITMVTSGGLDDDDVGGGDIMAPVNAATSAPSALARQKHRPKNCVLQSNSKSVIKYTVLC